MESLLTKFRWDMITVNSAEILHVFNLYNIPFSNNNL